jgi:hypothetical protein
MAKRKKTGPQTATVKISLQASDATANFYVNNAEVGHTPHDFTLACAKLRSKLSPSEFAAATESGQLTVEALVQITFPPTLMPGLLKALTTQRDLYEKRFGPIKDPEPVATKEGESGQ